MLVTLQKKCSKLWLIQQKERKDENSKQRLSSLQAAIQARFAYCNRTMEQNKWGLFFCLLASSFLHVKNNLAAGFDVKREK